MNTQNYIYTAIRSYSSTLDGITNLRQANHQKGREKKPEGTKVPQS